MTASMTSHTYTHLHILYPFPCRGFRLREGGKTLKFNIQYPIPPHPTHAHIRRRRYMLTHICTCTLSTRSSDNLHECVNALICLMWSFNYLVSNRIAATYCLPKPSMPQYCLFMVYYIAATRVHTLTHTCTLSIKAASGDYSMHTTILICLTWSFTLIKVHLRNIHASVEILSSNGIMCIHKHKKHTHRDLHVYPPSLHSVIVLPYIHTYTHTHVHTHTCIQCHAHSHTVTPSCTPTHIHTPTHTHTK